MTGSPGLCTETGRDRQGQETGRPVRTQASKEEADGEERMEAGWAGERQ